MYTPLRHDHAMLGHARQLAIGSHHLVARRHVNDVNARQCNWCMLAVAGWRWSACWLDGELCDGAHETVDGVHETLMVGCW